MNNDQALFNCSPLRFQLASSHTTDRKLRSLARLSNGWNYGEGIPPNPWIVRYARQLNRWLILRGVTETDVFPGTDGGLLFAVYRGDVCYEVRLNPQGDAEYRKEVGEEVVAELEGIPPEKAIKRIVKECISSACSTFGTSIPAEGASRRKHFGSSAKAYLSSAKHASMGPVAPSAITFEGSTPSQLVIRRSSGSSMRINFRRMPKLSRKRAPQAMTATEISDA